MIFTDQYETCFHSDQNGPTYRELSLPEYVAKQKQSRALGFSKFIGDENFRVLEDYAIKNNLDVEQLLRDTLIQKSKYLAKIAGGKNGD